MPDLARWTREQVLALPEDGNRYELIDGALLVTPSPRVPHQSVLSELVGWLAPYVEAHRLGRVLFSPADLFGRQGQLLQPDLFVLPTRSVSERWGDRAGQHSIRIDAQWRLCFRWRDGGAHDVEMVDYH